MVDLATTFGKLLSTECSSLLNLYSISECHDVIIGDLREELDVLRKYATWHALSRCDLLYCRKVHERTT
jgi:hypothetical protein